MRTKLAVSFAHVLDQSCMKAALDDLDTALLIKDIEGHRQPPGVYGRYFEMIFALRSGRHEAAASLVRDIAALTGRPHVFAVRPLTDAAMGADAALYARLLNAGEKLVYIAAPDLAFWDGFDVRVATAFDLLDQVDAALATEAQALICEVVAAMSPDPRATFGAISSLTLWGATVLSLDRHRAMLDIVETLVHEGAHTLLFGYASDEPLVTNPASESFRSPLRKDARPMDGVFHATFVCARLHLLYRALGEKRVTGLAADASLIEQRLESLARKFEDGMNVIERHARLTATGERLMSETQNYMAHVHG